MTPGPARLARPAELFFVFIEFIYLCTSKLLCGVIGNTSDSGSEKSKFEPWQSNKKLQEIAAFLVLRSCSLNVLQSF